MVLNKFFIIVVLRVILIVLSCIVLGLALQHINLGYYYTLAGIISLILLQTWLLINYVNRTNEYLEKFFSSVQDHDSSVRFKYAGNNSFVKLHNRMNNLNAIIQQIKIEHERTGNFLQSIIDNVNIGLISFDNSGKIEIYNKAAKRYFNLNHIKQIESLKSKNEELYRIVKTIRPGQEILCKITVDNLLQNVLIKAVEFKFDNNLIKLILLQDITSELDKKELDSWQKLIRVLTHEIMNSISPITSLTSVISGYFKKEDGLSNIMPEKIDDKIITKTLTGLNTIEETGRGLLNFVHNYRSLTSLPQPEINKIIIRELFNKCKLLMESGFSNDIEINTFVSSEDIFLNADYAQIEQVLINLIKNAIDAVLNKKKGVIQLKAYENEEGTIIQVEDNGTGISDEILDDIFVPFYTTKKNGSGIGLSLVRQIMQNHNGTISVDSILGKGATFTLKFQA